MVRHGIAHGLAGTLAAILLMEGVVRSVYSLPLAYEPGFGLIVRPGVTVRWGREGHATSRWTRLGIRRAELPDLRKGSILVLGDSMVEALQVDDEEVFTNILERRLVKFGMPVLNAGRSGSRVAESAAFAERNKTLFQPHWTVIAFVPDDLGPNAWDTSRSHFRWDGQGRLESSARVIRPPGRLRALLSPIVNHSMLLVYGAFRLDEFRAASAKRPPLFAGAVFEERGRPRGGAAGVPTSAGESPVCPAPEGGAGPCPIEAEMDLLQSSYDGRVTFLLLSQMNYRAPLFQSEVERRVEAHCAGQAMSCVNLRSGFSELASRGVSPFGFANSAFNTGHMNAEGHALAGRLLSAELERVLRAERPPGRPAP